MMPSLLLVFSYDSSVSPVQGVFRRPITPKIMNIFWEGAVRWGKAVAAIAPKRRYGRRLRETECWIL